MLAVLDRARIQRFITDRGGARFNLGARFSVAEHVAHVERLASRLGPLVQSGDRVVDIGCGSGILGFVAACAFPRVHWTLVDARAICADFVKQGVEELGLAANVDVVCARAEQLARDERGAFEGVVARRFGRPAHTAECSAPLLKLGGFLLVSDPGLQPTEQDDGRLPQSPPPERWPADGLDLLGLTVEQRGADHVVIRAHKACDARYPMRRRLKKPLF